MYVRMHVCECVRVCVYIYIYTCKLEYLTRYVVSMLFVCLHVRTYVTLVALRRLSGVNV